MPHYNTWVYLDTNKKYPLKVNEKKLKDPISINGFTREGRLLQEDGTYAILEFISKDTLANRVEKWVYINSSVDYPYEVDLDQLTITQSRNGFIYEGNIVQPGGIQVRIQLVSRDKRSQPREIWVYKDTSIPYPDKVEPNDLIPTSAKDYLVYEGNLELKNGSKNPTIVTLELISQQTKEQRTDVWTYENEPHPDSINFNELKNVVFIDGRIHSAQLIKPNGAKINLELVSNQKNKLYSKLWAYKGSPEPYLDPVVLSQLQITKIKKGIVCEAKGETFTIELVKRETFRKRRVLVWVKKGECEIYTKHFDPSQLKEPRIEDGMIREGFLIEADKHWVHLELITRDALRKREPVWVYKGESTLYFPQPDHNPITTKPDDNPITTQKVKHKVIDGIVEQANGQPIALELITQARRDRRMRKEFNLTIQTNTSKKRSPETSIKKASKRPNSTVDLQPIIKVERSPIIEAPASPDLNWYSTFLKWAIFPIIDRVREELKPNQALVEQLIKSNFRASLFAPQEFIHKIIGLSCLLTNLLNALNMKEEQEQINWLYQILAPLENDVPDILRDLVNPLPEVVSTLKALETVSQMALKY